MLNEVFNRFFNREQEKSKDIAKERLRLVLVSDRSNAVPDNVMVILREEIVDIISKYMEIDHEQLEFFLNRSEEEVALVANIPVVSVKRDAV